MLFKFDPIPDKEFNKANGEKPEEILWPDGEYDFIVLNLDKKNINSQDKFIVRLAIKDPSGLEKILTDWIPLVWGWKVNQYFKGVGRYEEAKTGEGDTDTHKGLRGKLKLTSYNGKNTVKSYLPNKIASTVIPKEPELNNDLPF